jgi:TPP-dependent pyruvate/acetoin dehydrogenase alpha subunit
MGDDRQLDWYTAMYRVRRVEETLLDLVRQREIAGSVHLCIGQEAIPVGACAALGPNDPVIATYRGHGWALARGVPLVELLAEALGRDSALNGGRGGSAYLSGPQYGFFGENSIVGAGVPMAMGLALSASFQGADRVPVVSIGDGALNQGVVHEALNMASVLRAGVIVLVEANGYAEMTPSDALTAVGAAARASAYDIEALEVDGNDPSDVARSVSEARTRARSGRRPVLIEAHTRRLGGHYSGDAQHYRPAGELEAWRAGDPLTRAAESIGRPDDLEAVRGRVDGEVERALAEARALPLPDPSTATDFVYAEG